MSSFEKCFLVYVINLFELNEPINNMCVCVCVYVCVCVCVCISLHKSKNKCRMNLSIYGNWGSKSFSHFFPSYVFFLFFFSETFHFPFFTLIHFFYRNMNIHVNIGEGFSSFDWGYTLVWDIQMKNKLQNFYKM